MPIMDGFDATAEILKYQDTVDLARKCKIVALTAYQNEETISRCLQIGMQKVYNKPASQDDIKEIFCLHFYDLMLDNYLTLLKIEESIKQQAKLII